MSSWDLVIGLRERLPEALSKILVSVETAIWLRLPAVIDLAARAKSKLFRRRFTPPEIFRRRLKSSNLVVVGGMGMINDAFAELAFQLLAELEVALDAGIPVVAFGQGLGPINDPELLKKVCAVFPRLTFISLREGCSGLPLLEALGVSRDRILITGDDAVELAYRHRPSALGNAIGINCRLAGYAGIDEELVGMLRVLLKEVAAASKRPLQPVPISLQENESDVSTAERLVDTQYIDSIKQIESPEDVIRLIGGCRVVVTGSYHAGVFALAQGIPVVGLVRSTYYEQKFKGLHAQFPGGCRVLDLRTPLRSEEIRETILDALESAGKMRESLLGAAAEQVALSREAYRTAQSLCPLQA